jgi:hypothetical protein
VTVAGTEALPEGEWTHVAATRLGGTVRLWVNGVLAGEGGFVGAVFDSSAEVVLGGVFDGAMDEVRLSDADRRTRAH